MIINRKDIDDLMRQGLKWDEAIAYLRLRKVLMNTTYGMSTGEFKDFVGSDKRKESTYVRRAAGYGDTQDHQ